MALEQTYKKSIIKGLSWSTLSKLSRQGIQLIFIFVLSRLLSPAEYGLMAMVMSFSMLAEIVRDMGTAAAIIQSSNTDDDLYNTAFCFNIVIGVVVFLVFFFCAPLISKFFGQPALIPLIKVFATIYVIGSLNIVQEAILQKNLEFKRLFFIDVISVTVSGIFATILAMQKFGVWSLVYQYIIMISIATIVLWATSSWKPRLRFSWVYFKQINSYSLHLFGNNAVYFFGRESDKFLIGKFIGPQALGIYHRAYMLMLMPINQINMIVSRVMFPVFSSLKGDIVSMKRIYIQSISMIAFFTFPMMALMFILARPLITVILGEKWLEVATYLQIFIVYSAVETVGLTTSWIYKSTGETKTMFRWGLFSSVVMIAAAIVGLQWGAKGVAFGYVVAQIAVLWIPGWAIAFKLINLTVLEALKKLLPIFLNSIAMAAVGGLVYFLALPYLPNLALIILVVAVSLPVYALLSSLTKQRGILIVGNFVKKQLRRFAKSA